MTEWREETVKRAGLSSHGNFTSISLKEIATKAAFKHDYEELYLTTELLLPKMDSIPALFDRLCKNREGEEEMANS